MEKGQEVWYKECTEPVYVTFTYNSNQMIGARYAVAQLVEALRYKSEGRGFDSP